MDFNEAFQPAGGTTGRSLVLFEEGGAKAGMKAVQEAVGVQVVAASGEESAPVSGGGILFESLGVAVVDAPPDQVMQAPAAPRILAVEPERIVYALESAQQAQTKSNGSSAPPPGAPPLPIARSPGGARSADYLRGYREAVLHLTDTLAGGEAAAAPSAAIAAVDESQATWGLQATKVVNCCRTGAGVRVAVLDTGFDLRHPDFAGRSVTTQSFIDGEAVQDGHGHGTHCIGTALRRRVPGRPARATASPTSAEIFAGKVLSNAGSGSDTRDPRGIEWAMQNKCAVDLDVARRRHPAGPGVLAGLRERRQARAAQGTLIIAAAGNESSRPASSARSAIRRTARRSWRSPRWTCTARSRASPTAASTPTAGRSTSPGPGVGRPLELAAADALPPHQRHQHGDPARRGDRGALRRGGPGRARRSARARADRRRAAPRLPSTDVGAGMVQAP